MAITFYDSSGTITSVVDPSVTLAQGTGFNDYATISVPSGGPTTVLSKSVAANETAFIGSFTVWGNIDADFVLKYNGTPVGGCRTSPSRTTETIGFANQITVTGPATITITGQHWGTGAETLQANLAGSINTNV